MTFRETIILVGSVLLISVAVFAGEGANDRQLGNLLQLRGLDKEGELLDDAEITFLLSLPEKPVLNEVTGAIKSQLWLWTNDELTLCIVFDGCDPKWRIFDLTKKGK